MWFHGWRMGLTASGGLGGRRRSMARRSRLRPSRIRTGLLGFLLALPIVAGFAVVESRPTTPNDPSIADVRPAPEPPVPPTNAEPAHSPAAQPTPAADSPVPARSPTDLARGSVDPADPVPGVDLDLVELAEVPQPAISVPQPPSVEPEQLTGYVWPLRGARIHGWFAASDDGFIVLRGQRVHDGLDLATFCGHRVVAAHAGTVLYAGRAFHPYLGFDGPVDALYDHLRAGRDWMSLPRVVVIDDGNGYRSAYVHLGSHSVKPGDVVKAGDPIGKEGATGRASGCHLHYMLVRMDGPLVPVAGELVRKWDYPARVRERIDPMRVLSFKRNGAARKVPGVDPPKVPFRYVPPKVTPVPRMSSSEAGESHR